MIDIRRILCPVDFSKGSRRALEEAVRLARWYRAEVQLLHVAVPPSPITGFPLPGVPLGVEMRQSIEADLQDFSGTAIRAGVGVTLSVRDGDPWREIVDAASELAADLIVIGTHTVSALTRMVVGSVTEKVIRKAPCPVITVPVGKGQPVVAGAGAPPFKAILCPLDFSPASLHGLSRALLLAKEFDARLILLHVLECFDADEHPRDPRYAVLRRHALRQLKATLPAGTGDWCRPEYFVSAGRPDREILRIVREQRVELIALGVGRGAVSRALFGSTTKGVLREASCPVLTVSSSWVAHPMTSGAVESRASVTR